MKKELVFKDDKSDKFWNIEVSGTLFTVTYGRSGTTGQSSTKTFEQETICLTQAQKLIQEKLKKGYVEEDQISMIETVTPAKKAAVVSDSVILTKEKSKVTVKPQIAEITEVVEKRTETKLIDGNFEENLITIRSLIQKNELMKAKDICESLSALVKSQNESEQLALLRGEIALIQNDFDTAKSYFLNAGHGANFFLGQVYQAQEDFEDALQYYLDAKTYMGYCYAAWIALNQNNKTKAIEYFELATIEGEKTNETEVWQSYFRWAYTLHQLGEFKAAIPVYQKTIDTGNADFWTFNNFAIVQMALGKYNEAITLLDKAIAKSPEIGSGYFNKCCLYASINNNEEALVWLQKAFHYGYLFNNEHNVTNDPDLELLRTTDEYKELIKKYKRNYSNEYCKDLFSEEFKEHPEKFNRLEIRFYNKSLPNGTIPDVIANGINIESIYIDETGLKSISPAVAQLKKLKQIQLLDNPLVEFPKELLDLKLETVDLEFKRLAAFPAYLGRLGNLKKLILSSLKINKIPKEISHFKDLEDFCIKHGQVEEIDREIGSLSKLYSLQISDTALKSLPVEIDQLLKLRTLIICENKQLTHLPESIFTLPLLERVELSKNGFPSTEAKKIFEEGLNAKTEKRQLAVFLALLQKNNEYVATHGTFEDAFAALNSSVGMLRTNTLLWIGNTVSTSLLDNPIVSGSEVYIVGKFSKSLGDIKAEVQALGATVTNKISTKTTHILVGEKPGDILNKVTSSTIQWVTESNQNKIGVSENLQMDIAEDFPQEQILSLLLSSDDSNVSMAIELIREYNATSVFETELFISYQYATDKKVKKEIEQLIKVFGSENLQTVLAGKYGFKSASEKKIEEYINTFSEKAGLDKLKIAYTVFRKTQFKAFEYLLVHGTSAIKKEVLEASIDRNYDYYGEKNKVEEGQIYIVSDEIVELKDRIRKITWRGGKYKEFPVYITELELLESLDISQSSFSKLPKEIANLSNLKKLNISTAAFKKFPDEILGLHKLEELILSNGTSHTRYSISKVPESIGQLKNLKKLHLANNPFGMFPMEILELENLEELWIGSIGISTLPDEFKRLKKLKRLSVFSTWASPGNANVFETFPSIILELHTLEELEVSMYLLLKNPKVLASLTNLKKIVVSDGYNDENREKLKKAVNEMLPECEVIIWR
ncbi:leucine-rich repeat domain-containing protein [Flavobacterium adhaerens]|uniref:leucine-rich repeat domain-containing protein n=1 Tax=Flavobacterium adhaerens TaxID=3149043 RepID=UPI0032B31B28